MIIRWRPPRPPAAGAACTTQSAPNFCNRLPRYMFVLFVLISRFRQSMLYLCLSTHRMKWMMTLAPPFEHLLGRGSRYTMIFRDQFFFYDIDLFFTQPQFSSSVLLPYDVCRECFFFMSCMRVSYFRVYTMERLLAFGIFFSSYFVSFGFVLIRFLIIGNASGSTGPRFNRSPVQTRVSPSEFLSIIDPNVCFFYLVINGRFRLPNVGI